MYDRVLHPTDGSEHAESAAAHAVEHALVHDAPLHALHVVDVTAGQESDVYSLEATDELERRGREHLEALVDRAEAAGVSEVTVDVVSGTPAKSIVEESRPGDLIVAGTHGRSGLDRVLIGSTAEKVVRTAEVPVLTVPLDGADEQA